MKHITIGIVGSRERNEPSDFSLLCDYLETLLLELHGRGMTYSFVSGGCAKGGDKFAEIIADSSNIPIKIHWPDKTKLPDKPQRFDFAKINYARNTLIAEDADILVALVRPDRKGGTENTIATYLKLGKTKLKLL